MKICLNSLVVFSILYFLTCCEGPEKTCEFSYKGEKISIVKYVDNKGSSYSYIFPGSFDNKKLPKTYVSVKNRWRDGWECLIKMDENQVMTLYFKDNLFNLIGEGRKIEIKEMNYKEFNSHFKNSTESSEFLKLSDLILKSCQ